MVKAMMSKFDTDGDGKLNPEERANLRNYLKNSDRLPGGLNNSF